MDKKALERESAAQVANDDDECKGKIRMMTMNQKAAQRARK